MSTQQLSEAVERLGVEIKRPVLSNLENKRRGTVSVAEVLVLAAALEVSPVRLVFPLERQAEPLPDVEALPWAAIEWFNGQHQLLAAPQRGDAMQLLTRYRQHQEQVVRWRNLRARLSDALADGRDTQRWEDDLREVETWLTILRAEMRHRDAIPPSLPPSLVQVDTQSTEPPEPGTEDGPLQTFTFRGDGSIEEEP